MNSVNRARRGSSGSRKTIAIKGFDEELYSIVKAYASLEGRTIASIFEEAIKSWLEGRRDLEEARIWARLERMYRRNMSVLESIADKIRGERGYAVICNGRLIGLFESYEEAIECTHRECNIQALVVKLPYRPREKVVELGFPW